MDSFRYLELGGESLGRVCNRKGLAPGERRCDSQIFPSELAILHKFCGMLFMCHHSRSGQILILLASVKSTWACAGVRGGKLVKLENNSSGTSEGGVKFSPLQLAEAITYKGLVGKLSI